MIFLVNYFESPVLRRGL